MYFLVAFSGSLVFHFAIEMLMVYTGNKQKELRINGFHIHHSIWGLIAVVTAFFIPDKIASAAVFGGAFGNILHHGITHWIQDDNYGLVRFVDKHESL